MTQRQREEHRSRVTGKHVAIEELKVGDPGASESCHKSLLIRKKFIKVVERQKDSLFLCPNKPEPEIIEGGEKKKTQDKNSC